MTSEHACSGSCALARRDFLGVAALAALALLETACGDSQIGPAGLSTLSGSNGTTGSGNSLVVTLSAYPALANTGGVARVDGGNGTPTALVRTGAASFVALSMRCPHQGYTISVNGSGFYCPAHGARFSGTGVWQSGQRTSNLTAIAATYDAVAGTVTIAR